MFQVRVLLIHNKLSWQPISWLSLLIRIFTCSKWNHIALEITSTKERYILESNGLGVVRTPYGVWHRKSRRMVLPLLHLQPETVHLTLLATLIGQPYGYWDLLNICCYLVKTRWFGSLQPWPLKNRKGYICSELGAMALGLDNPNLVYPGEFEFLPGLAKEPVFST